MTEDFYEGYTPLFELGVFEKEHPCVKILDECEICPTELAALCTVLLDVVVRTVPEAHQIEFEQKFKEALEILTEERHNYDVSIKYPDE
mgnify:CR=1 FL=1|jgi:hypothetical protein